MSEPNWSKAVADAMGELEKGGRVYPSASYLAVIDDIVDGLERTAITAKRGFSPDLIATALSHVTKAVHGLPRVPRLVDGGWYESRSGVYVVAPGFAAAWKQKLSE